MMKKVQKGHWRGKVLAGVLSLMCMLTAGLVLDDFAIVGYAQSQGKVTASSAKIRSEASAGSQVIGSTERDDVVDIKSQTTASDGMVWYQVYVNATTLGYIRSDLVQITDGSTPPATTQTPAATVTETTTPTQNLTPTVTETPAVVTAVEPISATVTNGQSVRVRANASTTSQIVTTAKNGLALTVVGQAAGTDGNVWYQVSFNANGTDVTGFIRSDYVALTGELVPVVQEEQTPEDTPLEEPEVTEPITESKDWETELIDGKWYLLNVAEGKQYVIEDMFSAVDYNAEMYKESQAEVSSQKVVIIVFVVIVILLSAALAFLYMKLKDMQDSAYFAEVEKETLRKRNGEKAKSGRKVMHTVGAEKQPVQRTQQRPAGNAPRQERPAGSVPRQERPVGSTPRQERPVGSTPRQERPAGSVQRQERPVGSTPRQERPVGSTPRQERPAGSTQRQEQPAESTPRQEQSMGQGWQSKNFMTDDDEFEFEFLNWESDEE